MEVPRLGHSRAQVEVGADWVVKRGPEMVAQGEYCRLLGPNVCPRVEQLLPDGYIMERLHVQVPAHATEAEAWMALVLHLLQTTVWTRPALNPQPAEVWQTALITWAAVAHPWLRASMLLTLLYPAEDEPQAQVLTHGDPTLANVLWKPELRALRLGDPLLPRPYVPSLPAVDRGKVLQSAMGWEHYLDPAWPVLSTSAVALVLAGLSPLEQARSLFWGAVHCARLLPYARTPATVRWAQDRGRWLLACATTWL